MTNKEAIEFLKNMIDREAIGFVCPEREGDVAIWQYHVEALQMAISALQAQEAKTQLSAEGTTSDLISRQDAIDAMSESLKRVFPEHRQIAEKCLKALPSAQPEPLWIPCSERLPEVGKDVMVCYDFKGHRSVLIGILYGDEKFHGYDDEYLTPEGRKYRKAVAWMPLPEPYRAERITDGRDRS